MTDAWPSLKLGELMEVAVSRVQVHATHEYPIVGVLNRGRGVLRRDPILGADTKYRELHRVERGMILYSRLKAFEGAVTVALEGHFPAFASPEFPTFRCGSRLSPEFFALETQLPAFWSELSLRSTGMGGRRERVSASQFLEIALATPPLEEQQRIVNLMEALDRPLAALGSEIKALTHVILAVRESFFAEAAAGAELVEFGALTSDVRRPLRVQPQTPYAQVGVRSHGRGLFGKDAVTGEDLGTKKMYTVGAGDLIFNVVFAWEGAVAIVPEIFDGWASSHRFPTFRRVDGGSEEYLRQFFLSRAGLDALALASPGGAGRNRTLGRSALGRIRVPRVALPRERAFVEAVTSLEAANDRLRGELSSLKELRARVLAALLSREVEIPASYDAEHIGASA